MIPNKSVISIKRTNQTCALEDAGQGSFLVCKKIVKIGNNIKIKRKHTFLSVSLVCELANELAESLSPQCSGLNKVRVQNAYDPLFHWQLENERGAVVNPFV
jgi:hypothetical protein